MRLKLKPLHEQVIFITGATSGIGLATLHRAVEQGAKVFFTARNEEELQRLQDKMRGEGYETAFAVVDVAEIDQLQSAVDRCITTFGRIDTFVNNAGTSVYGKLIDTTMDEAKRLFDTNFWGVVNGCKVAIPAMKEKGGSIINIGSVLSNVAIPIQGLYSASKHAVKGYTDALRREVMADKFPLQVTLIMPSAVDTPYTEHARSHIGEPTHQSPIYSADVVAKAILRCAVKPTRELGVGAGSYLFPILDRMMPTLADRFIARKFDEKHQSADKPLSDREHGDAGNLFVAPTKEGEEKGHFPGHVMQSSVYTEVAERKGIFKSVAIASGLAVLLFRRLRVL